MESDVESDQAYNGAVRDNKAGALRARSVITYATERLFRKLEQISPTNRFKGVGIDVYIVVWLLFAIFLAIVLSDVSPTPSSASYAAWIAYLFAGLRIIDILQAAINVAVFAPLGFTGATQQVEHRIRSITLLVINYFEVVLWFGIVYLVLPFATQHTYASPSGDVAGSTYGVANMVYFSAITQLTVGYGDITPTGPTRMVATIQASVGWLLTIIVIARFVSAQPPIRGLYEERPNKPLQPTSGAEVRAD